MCRDLQGGRQVGGQESSELGEPQGARRCDHRPGGAHDVSARVSGQFSLPRGHSRARDLARRPAAPE
eukprot:3187761-Pyramimonas_sp.AAC.1